MPTGYTEGILSGKIKTFPEFVKTCMRAFGACIHMKEESFDKKYEPRIPSDYHIKELDRAKKKLKTVEKLSDKEIIKTETDSIKEDINRYTQATKKIISQRKLLDKMMNEAKKWTPPTSEHENFKEFIINQLKMTIEHDGDTKFYDEELTKSKSRLKNINAKKIREEMIESANHDIQYHTEHFNEDVKRCNDANKWVDDLIKSFS